MDKFSINAYKSLMNTKGKWFIPGDDTLFNAMNMIVNLFMVANIWLYKVIDLGLSIFLENDIFNETIGKVFKVSRGLYESLDSALGIVLFLIAIGIIFFMFMMVNPTEAIKKLMLLFLVIGFNGVIYKNGETYLKDINKLADDVENVMVKAVSLPVITGNGEETTITGGSDSVKTIRETYFDMVIKQPFAMVNFGTAEFKKEYEDYLYTENESMGEDREKAISRVESKVKEGSEENYYLTPDSMLDKLVIGFYSLINNIFVGGTLLILAVAKFLLKLVLLAMVFILPLVSILSLIPHFSNSLFSAMGKMLAVSFLGGFLTVGLFLFYFVMMLIDSSIIGMVGGASVISCILALVVKILVIILMVKNQDKIVSFVTGGKIVPITTPLPNNPLNNQIHNERDSIEFPEIEELRGQNSKEFVSNPDESSDSFEREIIENEQGNNWQDDSLSGVPSYSNEPLNELEKDVEFYDTVDSMNDLERFEPLRNENDSDYMAYESSEYEAGSQDSTLDELSFVPMTHEEFSMNELSDDNLVQTDSLDLSVGELSNDRDLSLENELLHDSEIQESYSLDMTEPSLEFQSMEDISIELEKYQQLAVETLEQETISLTQSNQSEPLNDSQFYYQEMETLEYV